MAGARRHGVHLMNKGGSGINGKNRISTCKIGGCQGAGVVLWGAGDGTITDTWVFDCGGSNIYLRHAVDLKLSKLLLEGAGGWNLLADWCPGVHVSDSDMWGGRMGNVRADRWVG